ncbi:hypothetical protein L5515_005308 [Caenorhabditis briggsae]|uniref:Ubiquitin-like domain-containing protein n=2 Tax=Caenorhabditis briggsae TaxID=6238 RepID=A0AAE9JE04_CAEBR|nr:hypothetical protein L5515_005308 [Caenorhabditis briggsae]
MSEEPSQRMESDSGESDSEDQPLLLPFASTGASEDVPGPSGSAPGASVASGPSEAAPFGASGAFRPYVAPELPEGSRRPTTASVVSLLPTYHAAQPGPSGSSDDDDDDLEGTLDNMLQAYLSARSSEDPRSQTERTVARWAAAAAEEPNGPGPVVPGAAEDEQQVQVTVKTLDDREVSVTIGRNQPVQQLIDEARRQLNVTTGNQRIIFGGRVLNSTWTLQNAGITNGQTVHMIDRGPSGANDRPNINVPRLAPPGAHGHGHSILANHPHIMYRSMNGQMLPPPPPRSESPPAGYPYMRVPCKLGGPGGRTVLHARISSNVIEQRALPLILRQIRGGRSQNINLPFFMQDPAFIVWNFKIIETPIFRPRETFEAIVRQAINSVPYVADAVKQNIAFNWETSTMVLKVHFPEIPSHIPSPALERMNFLAFWTDHLTLFINKIEEADGLHDAVRQVLYQVQKKQSVDGLTDLGRDQRCSALNEIIREFEKMWAGLSHMRDFERDRFLKFQPIYGEDYRRLKFEQHAESSRNPLFVMRHALDVELIDVIRDFRRQQRRFSNLEELLDLLNESGALKFVRDSMAGPTVDYRLRALSMFFHYMQRARHLVGHMTHLVSELDVPILTPGSPQRILPHYAVNLLTVPIPYSASLSFHMTSSPEDTSVDTIPVNQIMPPPRTCSDIASPEWPHLPFYPPSVSADMAQSPARLVEPRARGVDLRHAFAPGNIRPIGPNTHTTPEDIFSGMSINDMLNLRPEQVEAILTQNMNIIERTTGHAPSSAVANPAISAAAAIRPRRIVTSTAGDTPSVPVETQPPPGNAAHRQEPQGPGPRYTTGRFNVHPDARGPDTPTLAPFPVQVEPRELQRIAKNIASRYREEALQRIATMLTTRFTAESWDTRINNLPLCTLRECIAVALELLASAGNDVEHSKNLMLALVRDEEVLVRAIAECVKSLFGRGEFPTHVARIIMPRSEAAGSRHDYESPDHLEESDEYDGMVVRMPSDVSQPQSGDLRAIRERRMRRREMMERNQQGPSTSIPSTSTALPTGPSFNEEDVADIRAGRLPTRPRRIVRETVHPTPARAASPTQISVTFTATAHPIHHHHHHHHHHPPGPPPPPTLPPGLPTAMAAAFQAALQDVHDDDDDTPRILRTTWLAAQNSSPPPPPNRSAGSSASSSFSGVVHLPRGSWYERQVVSPSLTTRGMMDFDLEADLEQASTSSAAGSSAALSSAAAPTSSAAEGRSQSAPNTTHASPIRQQRGDPMRRIGEMMHHPRDFQSAYVDGPLPQRRPRRNPSPKPMVAIDPFMACSNRFCELNMHSMTGNQETERFTMQSNMPDDEFLRHIQNFAPTFDRRPPCVPGSDSDYNYTVKKSESGELKFDSVQEFEKFVQTAVRSLYATCIDSDSLITLNMNAIAGHAPSNHSDLFMAVRQFLNPNTPPAPPPSTREHLQQMENRQRQADAVRHAAGMMAQLRGAPPPFPVTGPATIGSIPINPSMAELEILESGRIASLLSFLGEYMQNEENPRPTGVFGMLMELTYERLTAHEYAQLARPSTAPNVLMEYAQEMQASIRGRYLDRRMVVSNGELHEIAARIANQEEFFERFLMENPDRMPQRFQLGPDASHTVSTAWAFRQVEIGYVKSLLALAMHLQNPRLIAQLVIKFTHDYLYRNLGVFYRLANRDINQLSTIMRQPLARYFTTIRYRGFQLSPLHFSAAFEDWSFVINRWLVLYSASFEEAPFSEFLMMCSLGTDWNELETFQQDQSSPISSIPTTPGTATPLDASVFNSRERLAAAGSSTASLNALNTPNTSSTIAAASTATANNSRKRNHTGRQERTPDTVDMVVAPLMTSLTTSEEGSSTSSGSSGLSTSASAFEDHPMEE